MSDQFVQVVVGGLPYSIAVSDIEKFPGSFFECMIKKVWTNGENKPIVIERDGALFKYVYSFLVTNHIPRDKYGQIALDDDTLDGLNQEADFFGLDALSKECKTLNRKTDEVDVHAYMTIRKYVKNMNRHGNRGIKMEYSSALIHSLRAAWSPFCLIRKVYFSFVRDKLYKNSFHWDLKIDELIAGATKSPLGAETVADTVRNSFEIPASELNASTLRQISHDIKLTGFAPHMYLELRPCKLVIYQEGGHFDAHQDTVRGEGHIGTLVVILNSQYTGGELEVSYNKQTVTVTGAYKWVAMYGDCLHKINPVTSGTRVSLIYDIYGTPRTEYEYSEEDDEEEEEEEDEEEEEESDDDDDEEEVDFKFTFWERQKRSRKTTAPTQLHAIEEKQKLAIKTAVDSELASFDALIITLQHLYPECQTSPAFLKGGDRALYDLLSEHYDVQVVAATIYRSYDEQDESDSTRCALFSPAIVKRALGIQSEHDETEDAAAKRQRVGPNRTKLVISNQFDQAGLLDYTPYIEHTDNESQAEETVYLVAALQVAQRVV